MAAVATARSWRRCPPLPPVGLLEGFRCLLITKTGTVVLDCNIGQVPGTVDTLQAGGVGSLLSGIAQFTHDLSTEQERGRPRAAGLGTWIATYCMAEGYIVVVLTDKGEKDCTKDTEGWCEGVREALANQVGKPLTDHAEAAQQKHADRADGYTLETMVKAEDREDGAAVAAVQDAMACLLKLVKERFTTCVLRPW
mmetsp:Transcript_56272/g.129084  ORF Transcript_56272/g.129084 Transcript_56272/m.129084 type:complete len:196 (-) Transcript_56272:307-894(-)